MLSDLCSILLLNTVSAINRGCLSIPRPHITVYSLCFIAQGPDPVQIDPSVLPMPDPDSCPFLATVLPCGSFFLISLLQNLWWHVQFLPFYFTHHLWYDLKRWYSFVLYIIFCYFTCKNLNYWLQKSHNSKI